MRTRSERAVQGHFDAKFHPHLVLCAIIHGRNARPNSVASPLFPKGCSLPRSWSRESFRGGFVPFVALTAYALESSLKVCVHDFFLATYAFFRAILRIALLKEKARKTEQRQKYNDEEITRNYAIK